MIRDFLTETVAWKRRTGNDQFGDPTFATTNIRVRWEGNQRRVRNDRGEEVTTNARVFTTDDVKTGDRLTREGRDWIVVTYADALSLDGKFSHRELSL